ncbi:IS701 family transposase [Streptomyces tritici]|uniref:IS701 family transposase n=1 Tax=Streptomyces tritici TaxID=2054410 RepID=UPI003AF164F0
MLTSRALRPRVTAIDFAERIFAHLPRADQRHWAHAYLEGLLRTPGKKSLRRLAASVSDSPTASQSLHQFVNDSPWDWDPAYRQLMGWAEQCLNPRAWVIDVAVLRKQGEHSCGVHRRFVPGTGRSVNCQVGVGGFLVTANEAVPVDWRLLLPRTWTADPRRRSRARIPDGASCAGPEGHALDLVRSMSGRTRLAGVPVVADLTAHDTSATLVRGLGALGRDFVVAVPGLLPVVAGRHLVARRRDGGGPPTALEAGRCLAPAHDRGSGTESATVHDEQGRPLAVRSAPVHLPGPGSAGTALHRTFRLFSVRPLHHHGPAGLWLTSMTGRRLDELVALSRLRVRAAQTVRVLESDFGLRDFEGRSYPGWHRHTTLVTAAYAHSRLNLADRRTALSS